MVVLADTDNCDTMLMVDSERGRVGGFVGGPSSSCSWSSSSDDSETEGSESESDSVSVARPKARFCFLDILRFRFGRDWSDVDIWKAAGMRERVEFSKGGQLTLFVIEKCR